MLVSRYYYSQLVYYSMKHQASQSLCENICQLIFCKNIGSTYQTTLQLFPYEVSINFNVFSSIVLYWIISRVSKKPAANFRPGPARRAKARPEPVYGRARPRA